MGVIEAAVEVEREAVEVVEEAEVLDGVAKGEDAGLLHALLRGVFLVR